MRVSRFVVAAAVGGIFLGLSSVPGHAIPYTFTLIAETGSDFDDFDPGAAINSAGQVAFL